MQNQLDRTVDGAMEAGTAQLEYLVLVTMVALGFVGAVVSLGPLLLNYHRCIESLLLLPVP